MSLFENVLLIIEHIFFVISSCKKIKKFNFDLNKWYNSEFSILSISIVFILKMLNRKQPYVL